MPSSLVVEAGHARGLRRARRRRLHRGLALPLALVLTACAPMLPYRPDDPITVNVDLGRAGVRDERATFAALMQRELDRQAGAAASAPAPTTAASAAGPGEDRRAVGPWLHGLASPPPSPPAPATAARLAALDARFAARRTGTAVLMVPGMFGDCVSHQSVPFGDGQVRDGDGALTEAYGLYADLGLHSLRMVDLPGRESSAANGDRLAVAIRETAAQPGVASIVLVGYSKGVPDALHALARLQAEGPIPAPLQALVSVAGTVMGTPLADDFEAWYDAMSPRGAAFGCTPADGEELRSLTRRERGAWMAAHALPASLAYYSIAAYAGAEDSSPLLRTPHSLLATVDPRNDGQMIAADAILPGSVLLATARSDHWDIALPRERHPTAWVRWLESGRAYPREALFRATLRWVIANLPPR